jgi:hypothetical protein
MRRRKRKRKRAFAPAVAKVFTAYSPWLSRTEIAATADPRTHDDHDHH